MQRTTTTTNVGLCHDMPALPACSVPAGMLPGTSVTPQSTTAEAYAYPAGLAEAPDATHHLKQTDFSEYTEAALRHMHHLHQAKK